MTGLGKKKRKDTFSQEENKTNYCTVRLGCIALRYFEVTQFSISLLILTIKIRENGGEKIIINNRRKISKANESQGPTRRAMHNKYMWTRCVENS